jgi:hypothetical protein
VFCKHANNYTMNSLLLKRFLNTGCATQIVLRERYPKACGGAIGRAGQGWYATSKLEQPQASNPAEGCHRVEWYRQGAIRRS